jgi:hypothetical protein
MGEPKSDTDVTCAKCGHLFKYTAQNYRGKRTVSIIEKVPKGRDASLGENGPSLRALAEEAQADSQKKEVLRKYCDSLSSKSSGKWEMPSWMIVLILMGIVAAVVAFRLWLS